MSGNLDLIPLSEELFTFSPNGGVPTLGVSGEIQRAVEPALESPFDTREKVVATLTFAARQCRSNGWLRPGAPGHKRYFCVECGEPAVCFSTVFVSWLSPRFLPTGRPWIQSVGLAQCSPACERAISAPRRLHALFQCGAYMDRVGGYLPGDALFCTANTSAACVPVVFTHPFVHAPWPLGRAPRRAAVDPNAGPNTRPRVTIGEMLHNDRHLIPLNEVLYTFSSKGGVPTLGVDGLTQQLVRPALEGPVDSQDKVITTLACAARQSRASSRLLPGALGHNQYFCVECGEPAISFTTMCVSWLSARFWPAAGHPWIQSVGFAECSLACERAITDPQRLLRLFACAADGERVGGYETGDVVLSSTSMFPSCSPVAFPHPFVYAPWPLGLGPPMPVSDAGASASASASAVHQAAGTSSAAAAVDQAALTISHVIAPERDGTRASAAALAAPLAASSASRACANPTCRLPSGASVGDSKRLKQCSRCEKVRYCSVDCQKAHWRAGHKQACVPK